MHKKLDHRNDLIAYQDGNSHGRLQSHFRGRLIPRKVRIARHILYPCRLLRLPDAAGKSCTRDEMSLLGGVSKFPQIGVAAKRHRRAVKSSTLLIRDPSLSQHPARLLAHAAEHNFQGG